jgi:hypothetical protein
MADPRSFQIDEQETGLYTATIVGNDGITPLPGAVLSTLVLSLYAIKSDGTDAVINARNRLNVLNAGNVTISAGGKLTWNIQVADTTLIEDIAFERHYALWEWTWPAGAGKHEVLVIVRNLHRVP